MAIKKNRRLGLSVERFAIDERMHFRGHDFHIVEACTAEAIGHPLCAALDILLVLRLGADAGNAQELEEIIEVLVAFLFDVSVQVHAPPRCDTTLGRSHSTKAFGSLQLWRCSASARPVRSYSSPQENTIDACVDRF